MLNFDEKDFLNVQTGAVALAEPIHDLVGSLVSKGARNVFFMGSGGVNILMEPAARLLRIQSTFPTFVEKPAEVVLTGSRHLGPGSLVVMPSLSGTTKESVAALGYCKKQGATVISLTGHADAPVAQEADYNFVVGATDETSSESYYLQSLLLALSLMHHRGETKRYAQLVGEIKRLPQLMLEVKRRFEDRAGPIARVLQNDHYHVFTGAGSVWPEAHYYGMCILEEMQWIRTRPVHASDFFHGTLELIDKDVSVFLFKGEDECRPLADRVEAFAGKFTKKLTILDTAAFDLPGVSRELRALISPALLATVLQRVSGHLEVLTSHPLTTRRYYRQMAY